MTILPRRPLPEKHRRAASIVASAENNVVLLRHRCYIDSTPMKMTMETAAIEDVEGRRLGPEETKPLARTMSSVRMHWDFAVISAGQTTRWKCALWCVRYVLKVKGVQLTWGTMHP
jgi:hypothetical protein